MNTISITGNLTRDVEVRMTQDGKAVAHFTVAVKRPHTDDTTDFIRCVAWRKDAENISKFFAKGQYIAIRGVLITNTYEKDGQKQSSAEVQVSEWDFGGRKREDSGMELPSPEEVFPDSDDNSIPF